MKQNIYTLLVGIDNYKATHIPALKGCANDVAVFAEYLNRRVISVGGKLHTKTLINQQATRQAIIDGFRQHLSQAKSDDVVIFYFSGHGSQEEAPQEFWHLEPDHKNETLVCWDSRTEGIWDLADKEIAKLIAEVTQKNPHILVILDCCYSGGAVRSCNSNKAQSVRLIEANNNPRPIESFLFSIEDFNDVAAYRQLHHNYLNKFVLPQGDYIFLAACRDNEEAREHYSNQYRGVFSYFLVDTLQRANSSLSYRDIFNRTNALVRCFYSTQSPQIEATKSHYLDQPFLGGSKVKTQSYFTVSHHQTYGWSIDGGAIHGIIPDFTQEKTRLAIFPLEVEDLCQLSDAIAVAEISEILPQMSKINISGTREDLSLDMTYKAVITSLPLLPLNVYLEGESLAVDLARTAIQKASYGQQPSLYICEVLEKAQADFYLVGRNEQYLIINPTHIHQFIPAITNLTLDSALQAIQTLEHIARWNNIAIMTSPTNNRISADSIKLQIYQHSLEITDHQICLQYEHQNDKLKSPEIQIKLTNTSQEILYCSLFDLTEVYGIKAISFAGGRISVRLEPGQEAWVCEGQPISVTIPQYLYNLGVREYKDILKLIVSNSEFDGSLLEQDSIIIRHTRSKNIGKQPTSIAIDQAIAPLLNRAIVPCPSESQFPEVTHNWVSYEVLITTKIKEYEKPKKPFSENKKEKQKPIMRLSIFSKLGAVLMLSLALVLLSLLMLKNYQKSEPEMQKATYENGLG